MRFSFSRNLNDYYHECHGIGNSFYDHNHDYIRVHIHVFGMISIQLDETCDFSSKAHYFS